MHACRQLFGVAMRQAGGYALFVFHSGTLTYLTKARVGSIGLKPWNP
jgi:hypothetical protein